MSVSNAPYVLVLADIWCRVDGLCDEVRHHAGESGRVLVIAPALASRLHTWANDTDREAKAAQARLENILGRLQQHGVNAHGRIAEQDPVLAVEDALHEFAATDIIVVTEHHQHANWAERDLTRRIARPGLGVTCLTVAHDQAL